MNAILLLEDGTVFKGKSFGAKGQMCGEVVFNTSMTGYQEILTDPSYNEQIITMTYPLIGNYGTNTDDCESKKVYARGFIVREACGCPSNWRSRQSLGDYLKKHNVIGLEGIDTRMLVRHIRTRGAMNGIIATEGSITTLKSRLKKYPGLVGRDIVKNVTTKKPYAWDKPVINVLAEKQRRNTKSEKRKTKKVVAFDFGIKHNILRILYSHGCQVVVVPAETSAKEVLKYKPDGVFLSNGPGDPAPVSCAIDTTKALLGRVPIFGICLGHQILALALGGKTYKLKFGHRGANHPVKNLETGRIEITAQNHGFCVDMDSWHGLPAREYTAKMAVPQSIELTHLNLNDNTNEGLRCSHLKCFSVQYHPEASPGPHDSAYLFENFIKMM